MLKKDIRVGGLYLAKVSGKTVTVRVDDVYTTTVAYKGQGRTTEGTRYAVTNLTTKRKTVFRSAAKFMQEASVYSEHRQKLPTRVPPKTEKPVVAEKSLAASLSSQETQKGPPHLIIEALAGTGKTTTLIQGLRALKGLPTQITPSPQQKAIWDEMVKSKDAATICFTAFNVSIANELKRRVPEKCEAMTMHGLGSRILRSAYGNLKLEENRVELIMEKITGKGIRDLQRSNPTLVKATKHLVGLCKMNLSTINKDGDWIPAESPCYSNILSALASHYDIDLNHSQEEIFALVPKVLEACRSVDDRMMDYNDMIWLPVVNRLPARKYDLLLVDEAQDLNRCQQNLARKSGKRLIFCGDKNQAIYGFAGADAESLDRLKEVLQPNCCTLPLTVTRRCGRAIVEEAKRIVPAFEAHEDNDDGLIEHMTCGKDSGNDDFMKHAKPGDMVVCRVTAPLISVCMRFIKMRVRAKIQGRQIGKGLISMIEKLKASDINDLITKMEDWLHAEQAKENAKKFPSEHRLIALQDRNDCIFCLAEGKTTVQEVIQQIDELFTDDKEPGILLSTIHKAKGLEASRVFLLEPEGATVPHPMARTDWQKKQEMNLRYVAITRAISNLVYVTGKN